MVVPATMRILGAGAGDCQPPGWPGQRSAGIGTITSGHLIRWRSPEVVEP